MNWEKSYERNIPEIQSDNNWFLKSVFVYESKDNVEMQLATKIWQNLSQDRNVNSFPSLRNATEVRENVTFSRGFFPLDWSFIWTAG